MPHPPAEEVQLGLGHDPREPEQEPVVVIGRVVQPVLIGQQGAEHRAQFQELMPVLARAGQPAHLQAEDQPDVVETDFGKQSLEAEPALGRGPALALILVDDENAFGGQPSSMARLTSAYWRSVDSRFSATCWAVDWRT